VSFAVDTNVLLRSIDVGHAAQPIAQNAMIRLGRDRESFSIFSQNLIEFWAVATRPVANNGLGLSIAQTGEELTNLKRLFTLLPDTADILPEWEQLVVKHQVLGKQAHDARLVAAMKVHHVTHLLTFNTEDFKRFSEITVVNPQNIT
jgi:predicted nucleic acid-binding protein